MNRSEAKLLGLKRYSDGCTCPKGHTALRYTSTGNCVECQMESKREWAKKNSERISKSGLAYREANKEEIQKREKVKSDSRKLETKARREQKIAEKMKNATPVVVKEKKIAKTPQEIHRDYYEKNSDALKERAKKYYQENNGAESARIRRRNNPEPQRIARRKHYEKNIEKYRETALEYKRNNRSIYTAKQNERRARKLMATPPWIGKAEIAEIEGMYHFAKIMKMLTGNQYHVDHIIPLTSKEVCGLHVPVNLRVIPELENRKKYNKLIEDLV